MKASGTLRPGGVAGQRLATAAGLLMMALTACRRAPLPALSLLAHAGDSETAQDAAGGSLIRAADDARRSEGWSEPEPGRGDGPAIWAMGRQSTLQFFLTAPRPLRLALSAHPYPHPGAPPVSLRFNLNDTPLPPVALQPGWQDTAAVVALPAKLLRPGWNRLTLVHPWARRPSEFGQPDLRPLAVNFSRLDLLDDAAGAGNASALMNPGETPPHCGADRCVLPAGGARRWTFPLPPGARLQVTAAGAGARLRVSIEQDGEAPGVLRADPLRGEADAFELALRGRAGEPATLTLAAEGGPVELRALRLAARELPMEWRDPPPVSAAAAPALKPATVLIFLVDALRADHLSTYGYARPTSPRLTEFAATAERYDDARAVTSWTKPAVATILTGLPPERHGAGQKMSPLSPAVAYLPAQLQAAGYRTVALSASVNVNAPLGFARGFDEFTYLPPEGPFAAPASAVLDRLTRVLQATPAAQPLFLYVHILEPHTPYLPSAEFNRFITPDLSVPGGFDLSPLGLPLAPPAILQNRRDRYDGEVLAADDAFGRALALLRAAGREQGALVVFIADHGEEFGEHDGLEHGETLYPEVLRIPLLIRWPDGHGAGAVNGAPVSQIDLAPTLRLAAGLPAAAVGGGVPLQAPQLHGAPPTPRRRYASLLDGDAVESLRDGPWELQWIHRRGHFPGKAALQLYDLTADPGEARDLAEKFPARVALMQSRLRRAAPARLAEAPAADDPELIKQLKALGYLQ